jgi:branched-chain amino acid transport system ATP-binding protein
MTPELDCLLTPAPAVAAPALQPAAGSAAPEIEASDLVAGYTAEIDILRGISLHVRPREIVCILGPNGCGKSTLLKTIAGFLRPRRGRICFRNEDVGQVPVHRKVRSGTLGFVPQTDNVFGALSTWENLALGGRSMPRAESERRIEELCTTYPVLQRKLRAPASSLSGGERQVLSLARALMPRPRVLLLDEPSAGLSPKTLGEVFEAIAATREHEGIAVLMVEQNAMEALRIADRAYVLSLGTVALENQARFLMDSPEMRELYLGGRTH